MKSSSKAALQMAISEMIQLHAITYSKPIYLEKIFLPLQ